MTDKCVLDFAYFKRAEWLKNIERLEKSGERCPCGRCASFQARVKTLSARALIETEGLEERYKQEAGG